jgi:hypothetical protein
VTTRLNGVVVRDEQLPGDGSTKTPVGSFWQDLPSGTTYIAAITVDGITVTDSYFCPATGPGP